MLLLLPGAGDDLQGIKRGIVELADMIVVNKVDGDRIIMAKEIKRSYQNAIHLFGAKANLWVTKVFLASALQNEGLENIWKELIAFDSELSNNGYKSINRIQQRKSIFEAMLKNRIWEKVLDSGNNLNNIKALQNAIQNNEISIYEAINKFTSGK